MRRTVVTFLLVVGAMLVNAVAAAAPGLAPAQIERAIREFCGDANFRVVRITPPLFTRLGFRQGVAVTRPGYREEEFEFYEIDPTTGEVVEMYKANDFVGDVTPRFTLEQLHEIALAFARQHYRGFGQRPTRLLQATFSGNRDLAYFKWAEVLNHYGTLAPHRITVWVDTQTGAIVLYKGWHYRITGPTVPRISREEAVQIASQLAPWDPREVPLEVRGLGLWPDAVGVQGLAWGLVQEGDRGGWQVGIDAITGVVLMTGRTLGGVSGRERTPGRGVRRQGAPALWLNGKPLELALGVRYRRGRAYVPVEVAQLLGWWVERQAGGRWARLVTLREPERTLAVAAPVRAREGSAVMLVDGHLFVSVRWLASWCGATVAWDGERRRVLLTAPGDRLTGE